MSLGIAVPVSADTANGGTGPDTVNGHDEHGDTLNGDPGCDDVKGNGSPDDKVDLNDDPDLGACEEVDF